MSDDHCNCNRKTQLQRNQNHLDSSRGLLIEPFHRRYASAPPTKDLQLEHDLQQVILTRLDNTKTKSNISPSQRKGLRSLLKRKQDLHISVSDKGGEFIVITN
eukprot:sb/3478184/